ncbi:hypothetical protein os1_05940 [Comamonadaceae bacterium OS-1]|nr:hypothetical protein os1_05940 [Comamonadaceae bacterium OS-1]
MPIEQAQHHDHGLAHDLETLGQMLTERRRALRWLAVGSVAPLGLVACGGGSSDSTGTAATSTTTTTTTTTSTGTTTTTVGSCTNINSETAGPYPGDGTNSANGSVQNALLLSGINRSDIRSSIVSSSTTAAGIVLTVTLTLVNTSSSCASLAGYAIYLWHCNRDGKYSMYDLPTENYLRGVQVTDSNGSVTFTTVFPGCYSGRMPHIHFEVYSSIAAATTTPAGDQVRTSQIALPTAVCSAVYATTGYSASVANLAATSFATDNVFSDGTSTQMATVTGSTSAGYAASLVVGISA